MDTKDRRRVIASWLVVAALAVLLAPVGALAGFPADWSYWIPVTITEQSGNALTNYQVKVLFDSAALISEGKMQSECSDIRFATASGTPIPFWLEGGCDTTQTTVWVSVPSIPASGSVTLRLYFGNAEATSGSNGAATFPLLFDDGEGHDDGDQLTAEGWSWEAGSQSCQTYSDEFHLNGSMGLKVDNASLACYTCSYASEHMLKRNFSPALERYAIDWAFYDSSDSDTFEMLRAGSSDIVFGVGIAAGSWTTWYAYPTYDGCDDFYFANPGVPGSNGSACYGTPSRSAGWHVASATFYDECWTLFIDDEKVRDCAPLPAWGDQMSWLQLRNGRWESCSFGVAYYDVIRVRDYVDPEPLVSVLFTIPVSIDIKPGTFPNCINNNGKGVIPVAVFGASGFDVHAIELNTVTLAGMSIKLDKKGRPVASYSDVNLDGFIDLVVQITNIAGAIPAGTTTATLAGTLSNGTPIEGSDTICLVK